MKRFVLFLCAIFLGSVSYAQTIKWYVDDDVYQTTTCGTNDNIVLPATPTKTGYTFQGWQTYTPVEYLETNGEQRIVTNIIPPDNYWHGKFGIIAFPQSGNKLLVGALAHTIGRGASSKIYTWSSPNSNELMFNSLSQNVYHDIEYIVTNTGRTLILDGATKSQTTSLSFRSEKFYIFHPSYPFSGKIFYHQLFDRNGNLISDLVPAIDGDGKPCMIDKIDGTPYYNTQTKSDFVAGPVLTE